MVKIVRSTTEIEGRIYHETVVVEGEEPKPWEEQEQLRIVGSARSRVDGPERVSGSARYSFDIKLPGMLYAAIARCPHPRARLLSLDTRAAEALPGVRAVLTHRNTDEMLWYSRSSQLFATDFRQEGEEIAAVAADDIDTAWRAVRLVEAEYELLPAVIDSEEAMQPGAVQAHPKGNFFKDDDDNDNATYTRGDVERGLREADVIVESTYRTPTQVHNSMETHGCVAVWEGDQLTVYESTQSIYDVRNRLADLFKLPQNKVRVVKNFMGGGFGAKAGTFKQTVIAALLARTLGRPVHMLLDRTAENLVAGNRPATIQRIKLGARSDGTLTAINLDAICQLGAYPSWVPSVTDPAKELYRVDNVRTVLWGIRTNTGTQAAFRAPGYVEGTVALEGAMDELALKLGMDPLELRLKNYAESYQMGKADYTAKHLRECYERGAETFRWREKRDRKAAEGPQTGEVLRGYGMASQMWGGGGGPPAQALVRINPDGSVEVLTGTQDIGTGTRTVMAQIAAEALGFQLEDVTVLLGDTAVGPYSPVSGGSLTVASVGPAVRMAGEEAKQQLLQIAAALMDTSPDRLEIRDKTIVRRGGGQQMSVEQVLQEIGDYQITGKGFRGPNPEGPIRTWGVQFAEIAVDTVTGRVQVERIVAVYDTGRVINPKTYTSQIHGGIIQGLGLALTEQRVLDGETGRSLNPNLEGYKLPTIMDIPRIDIDWLDIPDLKANHIGAKGIGEPPIIPTPAAIANAVADALGVRIYDLPITPDKVLEELEK